MLNGIVILNLYFKCQLKKKENIIFYFSKSRKDRNIKKTRVIRIF